MVQSIKVKAVFANEPAWMLEYRRRNAEIALAKPILKSKYSVIPQWDAFLEELVSKEVLALPRDLPSNGIRVLNWTDALREFGAELKTALESESIPRDQFESGVNARFNSGFVLVIDSSVNADAFVSFDTVVPKSACAKTVVIVKSGVSNLNLLESVSGSSGRCNFTLFVEEGSRVFFVRILDWSQQGLISCQQVLEKDAFLHSVMAWQNAPLVRSKTSTVFLGAGSENVHREWVLSGGHDRLDLNLLVLHGSPGCKSHSVFKSVLSDSAYCVFDGMIKIPLSGQQATALLEMHGLLLSPNASNNSIPGLEIEADDVKATHSATQSQLDEESLFYLCSRGIPKEEAERMLVMGFLESLVHELPAVFHAPLSAVLEANWQKLNVNAFRFKN